MQACVIHGLRIGEGSPVRLMGVINCSPESFYRGSYVRPEDAGERALAMVADGADLVDVGARATGPGSPPLPVEAERDRMTEALAALAGTGVRVSVDTRYPEVLEACLRYEVHAVNDIGGLSDPRFADLVRDSGLPAVLMASRELPGDAAGFAATAETLALVVDRCRNHGIRDYILDPGIGRWVPGRTPANDWELVRRFGEFRSFGRPLLAAVSRKTFLGELLGRGPVDRLAGSLAAALLLALAGTGVWVSVDTRYPEVLESCLRYEVHAVNDIGGLSDPRFAALVSASGLPAVLMASRSVPGDAAGFPATLEALRLVVDRCREHGIRDYVLDPGIGRWVPGRTAADDWELVRRFGEFRALGRPLLAAASRKTFLGELLGRGPEGRLAGSLAAALLLALAGASVVRAHDVPETRDALAVLAEVRRA